MSSPLFANHARVSAAVCVREFYEEVVLNCGSVENVSEPFHKALPEYANPLTWIYLRLWFGEKFSRVSETTYVDATLWVCKVLGYVDREQICKTDK